MIEIRNRDTGEVLHTVDAETLHGANLRGADLRGANLSRANLFGADLRGADLHGADLSRSNLHGSNLHGANLSRANLFGADLFGANLRRANLSRANLHGANLHGAIMPEDWLTTVAESPPSEQPPLTDYARAALVVVTALRAANRYRQWEETTHETYLHNGDLDEPSQVQTAMEWLQQRTDAAQELLDSWPDYPSEVMRLASLAMMPARGPGDGAHGLARYLCQLHAAALAYVTGKETDDA